jgi:hypothetical protein
MFSCASSFLQNIPSPSVHTPQSEKTLPLLVAAPQSRLKVMKPFFF